MNYQALYRMFRPQSFNDVVGQEHVTKTLRNAISKEKQSHAYIFSGPRGTGKTSIAKVFAKAINCLNPMMVNLVMSVQYVKALHKEQMVTLLKLMLLVITVLMKLEILEIKLNTHLVNQNIRFIL